MPFVAICKLCKWATLSKRLKGIGFSLKSHFKLEHSREPYPDPVKIKMEDFKSHSVELDNWFSNRYYTFNSKIFYSYDYCIAVITHSDFDLYEGILHQISLLTL